MGESGAHKRARWAVANNAKMQQDIEKEQLAQQRALAGLVTPYAQSLIGMGQNALQGQAPAYFELGTRNQLASAFGQERQNLADFLGRSGQGMTGLAAGPAANLGAQESTAMGQARTQALLQAIGLGGQGTNIIGQQQSLLNPAAYGGQAGQGYANYLQATPSRGFMGSVLGSLLGAAIPTGWGQLGTAVSGLGSGNWGW